MNRRLLGCILALLFLAVLYGCSTVTLPSKPSVSVIEICSGRQSCNNGQFKITDPDAIGQAIDALSPFRNGWQTDSQMVFTTGWFTYPTPEDSILLRDHDGKAVLVIWLGTGWIGTTIYDGSGQGKYFRKANTEEVDMLRVAFRITLRSTGPAQKAAQSG